MRSFDRAEALGVGGKDGLSDSLTSVHDRRHGGGIPLWRDHRVPGVVAGDRGDAGALRATAGEGACQVSARCHQVNVTAREKVMLAFYRSVERESAACDRWRACTTAGARGRLQYGFGPRGGRSRIGTLTVSHIAPFADASRKLEAGELDSQRITTK